MRLLVVGAELTGAAVAWAASRVPCSVTLVSAARPASEAGALAPAIVFGIGPPGSLLDWIEMNRQTMVEHRRIREIGRSALEEALLAAERESGLEYLRHRIDTVACVPGVLAPGDLTRVQAKLEQAGYSVRRDGSALVGDDATVSPRRLALELLRQARARGADLRLGSGLLGLRLLESGHLAADIDGAEEPYDRVYWTGPRPAREDRADPCVLLHQQNGVGERPLPGIVQSADSEIVLFPPNSRRREASLLRVGRTSREGRVVWRSLPREWREFVGPTSHQLLSESWARPAGVLPELGLPMTCVAGLMRWPVASILGAGVELIGPGGARRISGPDEPPM